MLNKPFGRELRKGLAAVDLQFFKRFYFPHHFSIPGADMHEEFDRRFVEVITGDGQTFDVVGWPRGYGKTTHVDLGNIAWVVCFVQQLQRHHVLMIADSYDQAKDYLLALKDELLNNDRILEDFGDLKGDRWQEGHIITSNGVTVKALGAGMKIRGRKFKHWRPDVIICDDLEEIEAVQSETNRENMAEWFARSVLKAGNKDRAAFINIGTIIHHDSLLQRLLNNPMFRGKKYKAVIGWADREDLWEQWRGYITDLSDPIREGTARIFYERNEEEMLKGAVSSWPEGFSYYALMLMMITGEGITQGSSFWAEMQNEPMAPGEALFPELGLYRQVWNQDSGVMLVPLSGAPAVPLSACAIFGAIDPSLGLKKARRDPCAIIVLAKAPTGYMFVLEGIIKMLNPDEMINRMVGLGDQYSFTRFGVESVQFQALFASDAARASAAASVYLPIIPIPQRANKLLRIQSLQPDISNNYILFPEHGAIILKQQLKDAPKASQDDGPDALEIATRVAKEWVPLQSEGTVVAEVHTFAAEPDRSPVGVEADPYAAHEQAAITKTAQIRREQGLPVEEVDTWFPIIMG